MFVCSVVRVPPWPKEVAWYNSQGRVDTIASGGSVGSIAPDKYRAIEDGLGRFSLQVSNLDLVDQGEWKCVVTSQEGAKAMTCATVSVTGKLSLVEFCPLTQFFYLN